MAPAAALETEAIVLGQDMVCSEGLDSSIILERKHATHWEGR